MNVLLSIKPKYAEAILNGEKKYEFRKAIFKKSKEINFVYIYSSSPVKKVTGGFTIETIIEDRPKVLWKKFKEFGGINREDFFNYFKDNKKGFAIKIEKVKVFENPSDPKTLIRNFVPPQSFCYIEGNIFNYFF